MRGRERKSYDQSQVRKKSFRSHICQGPVQPRQDHARALVLPDFIDNNDLQPSSLVSAPILPPLPVHKTTGIMRTPIQPSQLAFGSSGSIDMFSFPSRESHNNDIKPDLTMTMIGQNEGLHFSQPILRHPEPAKGKCLQQNYTI